ncbi:anti-sigma factor [Cognatishimia sp. WU-CL00825]|uniref:anti-sigma factor family protein n=1 Tax=Cognatishimia sp. WU-CL00825 TaxID=3127658 RepID=UPI003101D2D5
MTDFNTIEERLSAYLDGEMSAVDRAAFEEVLEADPSIAERVSQWASTDDILQSLVPTPSDSHMESLMAANRPEGPRWTMRRFASLALVFLLGGLGGYGLNTVQKTDDPAQIVIIRATLDATSAHRLFTAEMRHAVEVGPEETDHLETWLAKRMGRQMVVPQLEEHGLTFIGGRLLPSGGQAAAQYMYEDAQGERVTVYMARTSTQAQTSLRFLEEEDLTTVRWQDGPWVFFVVAPLEREQLSPIAIKVHETLI